jgi:hypothetical protein
MLPYNNQLVVGIHQRRPPGSKSLALNCEADASFSNNSFSAGEGLGGLTILSLQY